MTGTSPQRQRDNERSHAADDQGAQHPLLQPNGQPQLADELARVDRLLAQLEVKSKALVPYGYWDRYEPTSTRSNNKWVAVSIGSAWFVAVMMAVILIFYLRPFQIDGQAPLQVPNPLGSDAVDQKLVRSVSRLANSVSASSERLDQIEAQIQESNREARDLTAKMKFTQPKLSPTRTSGNTEQVSAGTGSMSSMERQARPKPMNVRPTESATAHLGADGIPDYWIVPRGEGREPAKVIPVAIGADGAVVVYSLDDGKKYQVTGDSKWKPW